MGKVDIDIYFCVTADILTKVLLKCFWSSPLPTVLILSKSLILIGGHANGMAKFSKSISWYIHSFIHSVLLLVNGCRGTTDI